VKLVLFFAEVNDWNELYLMVNFMKQEWNAFHLNRSWICLPSRRDTVYDLDFSAFVPLNRTSTTKMNHKN